MLQSSSETMLTSDGKVFHLRMDSLDIKRNIILLGDPSRVSIFEPFFDKIESRGDNREFHFLSGKANNKDLLVLSTGIGSDNIDIVLSELQILATYNTLTKEPLPTPLSYNIIRLGTSGALHSEIEVGTTIISQFSIGLDGLLNYYNYDTIIRDSTKSNELKELKSHFIQSLGFPSELNYLTSAPYFTECSPLLLNKVKHLGTLGITLTAPGFYAPQYREAVFSRNPNTYNQTKLFAFTFKGLKTTNLEMECAPIYGFSHLGNHHAITLCIIIANRDSKKTLLSYNDKMLSLIKNILSLL